VRVVLDLSMSDPPKRKNKTGDAFQENILRSPSSRFTKALYSKKNREGTVSEFISNCLEKNNLIETSTRWNDFVGHVCRKVDDNIHHLP